MTENGQTSPFAYLHNEAISVLSAEEVVSLYPGAQEKYNDYMSPLCRHVAALENWSVHLFIRLSMKVGWATWMNLTVGPGGTLAQSQLLRWGEVGLGGLSHDELFQVGRMVFLPGRFR